MRLCGSCAHRLALHPKFRSLFLISALTFLPNHQTVAVLRLTALRDIQGRECHWLEGAHRGEPHAAPPPLNRPPDSTPGGLISNDYIHTHSGRPVLFPPASFVTRPWTYTKPKWGVPGRWLVLVPSYFRSSCSCSSCFDRTTASTHLRMQV
jgi:hypothetical protein